MLVSMEKSETGQCIKKSIPISNGSELYMRSTKVFIPVLQGAPELLVSKRQLQKAYYTNDQIKTWATFFLLKALSSSGCIKIWTKQKQFLLEYCKCCENSFRKRLKEMKNIGLVSISSSHSLLLISYERASKILGIPFTGLIKIEYDLSQSGQQIFQYHLRATEIRSNQLAQVHMLWYYAGKNPLLKNALTKLLIQQGSNLNRLQQEPLFFQQELLKLQKNAFKEGSPLLSIIHSLRADINRSCRKIQEQHNYVSKQSVSYMKRRLMQLQLVSVKKVCVKSKKQSRMYLVDALGNKERELFKWLGKEKVTAWFLCDQITLNLKYLL